jgi:hypothetical protein
LPWLVCSALLLKRWMGSERAWLPLVAIGLSPTQLYFNNLGTSYGTDVELFPVVLFVIASIGGRRGSGGAAHAVLSLSVGSLAMFACLSTDLLPSPPLLLFCGSIAPP